MQPQPINDDRVSRLLLKILALLVAALVLIVFISPALDLEPTAWRAALMLALLLLSLAQIVAAPMFSPSFELPSLSVSELQRRRGGATDPSGSWLCILEASITLKWSMHC